jgi:NitT/TauT family transport system permease protein
MRLKATTINPHKTQSLTGTWFREREGRLLPLVSFVAVAILWEIGADTGVLNPVFFPPPTEIVRTGVQEVQSATFWGDVGTSVFEFLWGYLIAITLAFPCGVLIGWFRRLRYLSEPWVDALNATPTLALMPLVLIWFGLGTSAKVAIVFITAFIPVVLNVYTGVRTVDHRLLGVAASFGATRNRIMRTVVVPSVAPFGFAGARIGVGRAVSGVVVGEFFASDSGLAFRIFHDAQLLQTASVLFYALVITFLALGAFNLVGLIEHRVLRWRSIASGSDRALAGADS